MNYPDWLKPYVLGAVSGAALATVVGFTWGGWVTGGDARQMSETMSDDKVIAALVPVCVAKASADLNRAAKLETIRGASSYQQREALMEAGWATMPGTEIPNRDLAQACVKALEPELS
ncbi:MULTISPECIES: hypothetical protein [unclassified Thalassospira]|uniref:hypothetical protein n=1 Tax=unclassified Thalassospira TaxID=2648997 RepID=UPI0007A5B8FC|nr:MULTISPECIES: hypothetical protein [unclassified Thalassospira]KZC99182.1 hypothetical protein AUQ41_11780 [Thalassospira sp. MCCC 1A02898]ONH88524.1 hypothetical protein TH47_00780 [Thalassospira sp. MCCC 1A02803]